MITFSDALLTMPPSEIFGPILSLIEVESVDEAIEIIVSRCELLENGEYISGLTLIS